VPYPSQVQPPNYYQAPQQPQPTYYPTDYQPTELMNYSQPWAQQPTQPDPLNVSSQIPSANSSSYQPPGDQSSYIQPGFTSTPNPYSSQQPWHPQEQNELRDRLPSNEVCKKNSNRCKKLKE